LGRKTEFFVNQTAKNAKNAETADNRNVGGLALAAGRVLRPGKLPHLELKGAKVDELTVFETGGLQVTKDLSHMLDG